MYTSISQDFVIAVVYMAAQYTWKNLEPVASVEWRDAKHLYDEIKYDISENDWERFEQDFNILKGQFGIK